VSNYYRKEKRFSWSSIFNRDRPVEHDLDETSRANWIQREMPTDKKMEQQERAKLLWQTIQALDARYRVPLVLHHYEEMSYKEIAEALQLTMSAVESRIHRAKKQLVSRLEPWLDSI
jgi:RNA polymerase sigma-70 factor (ECF subfamily)